MLFINIHIFLFFGFSGALKVQRENENSSSTPIPTSAAAALHDNVVAKSMDTFAASSVDARLGDLYWNTSLFRGIH